MRRTSTSPAVEVDEAAARRQRRILVGAIVAFVAVTAGAGLLFVSLNGRERSHSSMTGVSIALGVLAVFLALIAVWAFWLYRRPAYRQVMHTGGNGR